MDGISIALERGAPEPLDGALQDVHQSHRLPSYARHPPMYYDDQGRRFNVLSGLLFGALLGAGVTLLATPVRRRTGEPQGRVSGSRPTRLLGAARTALLDALKEVAPRGGRTPVSS